MVIELLRDPIMSGIGSLASIASLFIYVYLERSQLFAKPVASIGRIVETRSLNFQARFGMVLGLLLNLGGFLQTLSFAAMGIPVFWWIGRVVFYATIIMSCAVVAYEWQFPIISNWRDFIRVTLGWVAYFAAFAVPVIAWVLLFSWLQPEVPYVMASNLVAIFR